MNTSRFLSKGLLIPLFLMFIGAFFGMLIPDLDQQFLKIRNLIQHRSILTHSFLLIGLLFWIARREKAESFNLFLAGASIGLAIHLSFDLFPKAWQGLALIYVPVLGNMSRESFAPIFSFAWLLANVWISLSFTNYIVGDNPQRIISALIILIAVFFIASQTEQDFWKPLVVLLACLLTSLRSQKIQETVKRFVH